jgi:hypothetical protein
MVIDFNDSAEAIMHTQSFGSDEVVRLPVGLDGVYRMSLGDHNLPQGYRGYWADDMSFIMEYDNIANNDHAVFQARFEGERVLLSAQETAHELSAQFEGRLQNP